MHQIGLGWSQVPGATHYNVYRGSSAGGEDYSTPIGSPTGIAFNDTNVVEGATYFYTVKAANAIGESGPSNEVSGTIPMTTPPAAPQNLTISVQ